LAAEVTGIFVTFEGGEGGGKSTQVKLLADRLLAEGRDVVTTREPGGSPGAESLRALLVSGETGRWTAEAEALLNYAARDNHLHETIRPALARGAIVLCDRFMDSTRAYQGYAGGCPMALIDALERCIVGTTRPRLTLILDLDPRVGLRRTDGRAGEAEDRFERKGLAFHKRLREGFLLIAQSDPARCRQIDAGGSIEDVAQQIERHVRAVL
jgi:dTMP kinase